MAFDDETLLNWHFDRVVSTYTQRDTMLYALGLGFGFEPTATDQLRYVYEKNLCTFPTMAVVLGHPGSWMRDPRSGIDVNKVLHAEQDLQLYKLLPTEGTVIAENQVVDVVDKGADKGALIIMERKLYEQSSGDLLCLQRSTAFARANGGFGGSSKPKQPPVIVQWPDRKPDFSVEIPTSTQSALLYRLSGDYNEIHADPEVAKKAGFKVPILHGLASYGIAARSIMSALALGPDELVQFGLRFSSPVYPGETLRTELWKTGNEIVFRSTVVERDVVALNNGRAVIGEVQ